MCLRLWRSSNIRSVCFRWEEVLTKINLLKMSLLQGQTIVFSGTLQMKQAEAKKMAETAGAKVTDAISGKTDFVVSGPGEQ